MKRAKDTNDPSLVCEVDRHARLPAEAARLPTHSTESVLSLSKEPGRLRAGLSSGSRSGLGRTSV